MSNLPVAFDQDQIDLIKRTICKDASNDELAFFLHVCKVTGLDPISRQIYAVQRWDSKAGRNIMSIQTSIDGFRLIADRSGKYQGQVGPFWCGENGVWKDVWFDQKPPKAARVGVNKEGFKEPLWGVAVWDSYCQTYEDKKTGKRAPTSMWAKMPELMLAKCAEALALRKAFPQELSNLYTADEMAQANATEKPIMQNEPPKTMTKAPEKKHLKLQEPVKASGFPPHASLAPSAADEVAAKMAPGSFKPSDVPPPKNVLDRMVTKEEIENLKAEAFSHGGSMETLQQMVKEIAKKNKFADLTQRDVLSLLGHIAKNPNPTLG